jgi:GTPase SAR1 family protein
MMEIDPVFNISNDMLAFHTPLRMLICGPSLSGKSTLVLNLLKHREKMFNVKFDRIVYSFPDSSITSSRNEYINKLGEICPNLEVNQNLPDIPSLISSSCKILLIIEDQMKFVVNNPEMHDLMTIHSHHSGISVILTSQNYYIQGRYSKTILRNTSEKIVFNDKGDQESLRRISMQMFPGKKGFLNNVMAWILENISDKTQHYICIDNSPISPLTQQFQIRTNIFPDDDDFKNIFFSPKET